MYGIANKKIIIKIRHEVNKVPITLSTIDDQNLKVLTIQRKNSLENSDNKSIFFVKE